MNELTRVSLNGVDQWVLMRGASPHNPILLFLHGGPGFAQIHFAPAFQAELEQRFIVTNWDQRGAGKSYVRGLSAAGLTLQTYVDDTAALLRWLIGRFGQSRVLLVGHSWGSTVGMQVARQHPDLLHGFVATGFGIQFEEGERVSIRYLLGEAERRGDRDAIRRLESIRFPIAEAEFASYVNEKSKWLGRFGGYFKANPRVLARRAVGYMVRSRAYSLGDYVRFVQGIRLGQEVARRILPTVDLSVEVPEVAVPVWFCIGRHDYHTPFEVAHRYFEALRSPGKRWFWFENSAHSPPFEEPERFAEVLAALDLSGPSS